MKKIHRQIRAKIGIGELGNFDFNQMKKRLKRLIFKNVIFIAVKFNLLFIYTL